MGLCMFLAVVIVDDEVGLVVVGDEVGLDVWCRGACGAVAVGTVVNVIVVTWKPKVGVVL